MIGRVSGQPTIQVTDRIDDAEGKLAGIIVFSLSPEFLTTLHRVVNLGKTGSMILMGEDGAVRASYGAWQKSDLDYIGKTVPELKAIVDANPSAEGFAATILSTANRRFCTGKKSKTTPSSWP